MTEALDPPLDPLAEKLLTVATVISRDGSGALAREIEEATGLPSSGFNSPHIWVTRTFEDPGQCLVQLYVPYGYSPRAPDEHTKILERVQAFLVAYSLLGHEEA